MLKRFQMDMTTGPIMKKLIIFAIPLIFTNILQSLFHTADVLILGIFTTDIDVGAVGSTSKVINLVLCLFIGLSMGTNVVVAKYLGRKDIEKVKKSIGASFILCLIGGIFVMVVGYLLSPALLKVVKCREVYYDGALKYMRTYFIGVPLIVLYNFCSAIMRASGDTTRPLIFLIIGGVINIILNILFVIYWDAIMGVAIATIASQGISAILSLICIIKNKSDCKFEFKYFKFYATEIKEILVIGIPSGIQSMLFNISNIVIQRNLNMLGDNEVVSADTLASQFDAFIYQAIHSIALATLSFTSQNYGARDINRIKKIRTCSLVLIAIIGLVMGITLTLTSKWLCSIGINDDKVVGNKDLILHYAFIRHVIMGLTYFICGWMDSLASTTRGVGRSISAMVITLLGSCVFRIIWVEVIIDIFNIKSVELLYSSWPISWAITCIIYAITQVKLFKTIKKEIDRERVKIEQ